MANNYYYLVPFHAKCEECGERFPGIISQEVPVNDSALAGNILNSMADSADAAIRRKKVENAVNEKRWSDLDMRYGLGHACPNCGARQSWDPMRKPVEPKRSDSAGSKAAGIGCFVGVAIFVGLFVSLVVSFILQINFANNPAPFIVSEVICIAAGIALGVRFNKKDDERLERNWPQAMAEYENKLNAYNAYQQRLQQNRTRNEPVVALSSGRFVDSLEGSFAINGLDWRDF